MISPAFTSVPLYHFPPSRWAFESRPLREDAAPFFFDTSGSLRDRGDLDGRVLLAVAPALALVRLRLVREAVDLRPAGVTDDACLHRRPAELGGRGEHGVAVDH